MIHYNPLSSLKFTWLLLVVLISACPAPTKTEIQVIGSDKFAKSRNNAIVLFPTHDNVAIGKEENFINCLNKNLRNKIANRVNIIDTRVFQDHTFPWFEPNYAPTTIDEMNALLSQPVVRERIASIGVQYLINIAISSDDDVEIPGIFCGGGYGGAGCLGVYYDNKKTKVYAVIFDIVDGVRTFSLSATTSGKSVGFAFIIPVLFLADTEKGACKALSDKIGQLIIEIIETN